MNFRIPACILLTLSCAGCSSLATYGVERVRDLSDVVDVRYGTGFGIGIGVQYTSTFMTGLGCSLEFYQRQWFGRKSVETRDGLFSSAVIVGVDGDAFRTMAAGKGMGPGSGSTGSTHILILGSPAHGPDYPGMTGTVQWFTTPAGDPPALSKGRIGGTVFLPGVIGGLYLNLGEFVDFLCGVVGYDLMNDEGYPKFSTPTLQEEAAS